MPQTVGQYLGATKGPVINQHNVTDAYREGCERMGWVKLVRYCKTCGMLPAWCECKAPGGPSPGLNEIAQQARKHDESEPKPDK